VRIHENTGVYVEELRSYLVKAIVLSYGDLKVEIHHVTRSDNLQLCPVHCAMYLNGVCDKDVDVSVTERIASTNSQNNWFIVSWQDCYCEL
jgi:hypothetical protein